MSMVDKAAQPQLGLGYRFMKRIFDIASATCGVVVLSPVFLATAIAVKITSPGPVIFKQKRYGKNKAPFELYKFRSMTIETPPDVPTREMNENKSCFTPIGGFIRKHSLDELPQFINIIKGDMSVIGPRPVILRETDQITERDRYGVNDIRPGLTGWAQINGRDGVGVEEKARLDAEYRFRMSVLFDIRVFLKSVHVVLMQEGFGDAIAVAEAEREGKDPSAIFADEMAQEMGAGRLHLQEEGLSLPEAEKIVSEFSQI